MVRGQGTPCHLPNRSAGRVATGQDPARDRSYARNLVPVDELTATFEACLDWLVDVRGGTVDGAYLEFGVCTGSSMIALNDAIGDRTDVPLDFVGWFADTLHDDTRSHLGLGHTPLIMVDCDICSAAAEALAFVRPHIGGPTVIIFDDWYSSLRSN